MQSDNVPSGEPDYSTVLYSTVVVSDLVALCRLRPMQKKYMDDPAVTPAMQKKYLDDPECGPRITVRIIDHTGVAYLQLYTVTASIMGPVLSCHHRGTGACRKT